MNKKTQFKWKLTRRNNIYLCTATKVGNGLSSSSLSCNALARVRELNDATAIGCAFNLKPDPPLNAGLFVLTQALLRPFYFDIVNSLPYYLYGKGRRMYLQLSVKMFFVCMLSWENVAGLFPRSVYEACVNSFQHTISKLAKRRIQTQASILKVFHFNIMTSLSPPGASSSLTLVHVVATPTSSSHGLRMLKRLA